MPLHKREVEDSQTGGAEKIETYAGSHPVKCRMDTAKAKLKEVVPFPRKAQRRPGPYSSNNLRFSFLVRRILTGATDRTSDQSLGRSRGRSPTPASKVRPDR